MPLMFFRMLCLLEKFYLLEKLRQLAHEVVIDDSFNNFKILPYSVRLRERDKVLKQQATQTKIVKVVK